MRNEFYIFTDHALDRCKEQGISKVVAISLIQGGEKEDHKPDARGAYFVRNGSWIFTLKQLSYDKEKGSIVRVITVTNQITTTRSYVTRSYRISERKGELPA